MCFSGFAFANFPIVDLDFDVRYFGVLSSLFLFGVYLDNKRCLATCKLVSNKIHVS